MPRRVYVDCPSLRHLLPVLAESPYGGRVQFVPNTDLSALVEFLEKTPRPLANHWVRLTIPGPYKGQVGIVSKSGTILTKRINRWPPADLPVRIVPVHPSEADIQLVEGLYAFTLKTSLLLNVRSGHRPEIY